MSSFHRPGRRAAHHPNRVSTGSLPTIGGMPGALGGEMPGGLMGPHHDPYGSIYGPAPPAPAPPGTSFSPRSSVEDLGFYPPPMPGYPPPPGYPPMVPMPGPPPAHSAMRGGDASHLSRRNTTVGGSATRPAVVHHAHSDYDHYSDPAYDYPPPTRQRPVITHRDSRSSSHTRSPDETSAPFMVIPHSGGSARTYHPGSQYSDNSYVDSENAQTPKGYITSAGGGAHRFNRQHGRDVEYNISGPSARRSESRAYHGEGPPRRRRDPSMPRTAPGADGQQLMSLGSTDDHGDDRDDYFESDRPGNRRVTSGPVPSSSSNTNSGALVRSRSRSASQGPVNANTGAMVPHRPQQQQEEQSGSAPSPPNNTIRLEYGGQAIDIAYSGDGGKPLGITINTTSRTVSQPGSASPPSASAPAPAALPAPPAPAPQAPPILPANVPTVPALPPPNPPPAGSGASHGLPQILPAPGPAHSSASAPGGQIARRPGSHGSDGYPDSVELDHHGPDNLRKSLYEQLAGLQVDPAPPTRASGANHTTMPAPPVPMPMPMPSHHHEPDRDLRRSRSRSERDHRERDRDRHSTMAHPMPPPSSSVRTRSRSRHRSSISTAGEPLWTKISRDIVSRRAVLVRGYDHEETPDAIIIYRVLSEKEIDDLVDLSDQIRAGKVEVVRRGSRRRSESRHRPRPVSYHGGGGSSMSGGLNGGGVGGGPGPSKERPKPGKPAIVYGNTEKTPPGAFPPPEVPDVPGEEEDDDDELLYNGSRGGSSGRGGHGGAHGSGKREAPPVQIVQTKNGGLREDPTAPGTYIGYTRRPPPQKAGGKGYHGDDRYYDGYY